MSDEDQEVLQRFPEGRAAASGEPVRPGEQTRHLSGPGF
jgi:hypothetical protein